MSFQVGSYVLHRKLAELGAGEIVKSDQGALRIRFASGERNFSEALAGKHLEITSEPPAPPPKAPARKKPSRKKEKEKEATK
jgi:hypothetical protein